MTPARKAALQWFHDRGDKAELSKFVTAELSGEVTFGLVLSGLIACNWNVDAGDYVYTLTDKGRRALNGDSQ